MNNKGQIPWNKGMKGIQPWHNISGLAPRKKGWEHSAEAKKKISEAGKGRIKNEEEKKKISERMRGNKYSLGFKQSEEHKRKKSEANKGKHKYWLGKKFTEEHKRKMSGYKGEKSYSWKGGKSFEIYPQDWTEILKNSIRERDNFVCAECGCHQEELENPSKLDVHHIDYDKKNCNPDNLITLCRPCHVKTNTNREYWINYFNS